MTEYVEKELLYKRLLEKSNDEKLCVYLGNLFIYALRDVFSELPTADVVEVRHGEWKQAYNSFPKYVCTNCNHLFNNKSFKYCPNCGAKMDGERRAEE